MASPEAFFFFFFSSRRRHTRCSRDWSSDVCSSDLWVATAAGVILVVLGLIPKISAVVEGVPRAVLGGARSEEHTSELQSRLHLVCRLLLEKKNKQLKQLLSAIVRMLGCCSHA